MKLVAIVAIDRWGISKEIGYGAEYKLSEGALGTSALWMVADGCDDGCSRQRHSQVVEWRRSVLTAQESLNESVLDG